MVYIWWNVVYNGGSGCYFLASASASDRSNTKRRTIFVKMPKSNHIKIVIFRKHFSLSLRKIYGLMFLFWYFDLFYFFAQFLQKTNVPKTLFKQIFATPDALLDPIWHKLYYQHKIWSLRMKKNPRQQLLVFGNVSKR